MHECDLKQIISTIFGSAVRFGFTCSSREEGPEGSCRKCSSTPTDWHCCGSHQRGALGRTHHHRQEGGDGHRKSLYLQQTRPPLEVLIEHIKYSMKPRGDLIVSKWGLKRTKLLIERQGGMYIGPSCLNGLYS